MGSEIVKCECEHHQHGACRRPPALIVRTDYGKFALCEECYKMLHMAGVSSRSVFEVVEVLSEEYRNYLKSPLDPRD